jgi:hypothetical protein
LLSSVLSIGVTQFENTHLSCYSWSARKQAAEGLSLTRDELSASYAIIRHNVRTYRSDGVVEVVRGKQNAESELKKFEESQHPSDRHEGWRYFLEKTDLKAGTDPTEATRQRQAELEVRESKALREAQTPIVHSANPQR